MKVWVVIADYGMNGAGCMGVFAEQPTEELLHTIEVTNFPNQPYPPRQVTGYSGMEAFEMEVQS
jgi:hypothetical protein